jgi:PAS domain S-box-containing protein
VVGFIFIVELTEEWISPILQGFIKIDHLNGILWIALSAPLIWWFVKYRNRSQEELLENEEKFRSVIQTANDAIILADNNGNIISWNNCAQNMFGYESREILAKSLSILMPEQYDGAHRKIWESMNSTGKSKVIGKTIEASGRKKDGSDFPIEFSVSSWSTKHRRFYTGIIRDVTGRKQAEDLLKKSKEFAETVLNNLDDTISVIDVKDFRILDVNKVFLEKCGMKKEDVLGKTCHEIIHKSANQCLPPDDICPLLDTLNTGKITTVEHIHYAEDKEKRYVTVSTSPIKDESGKVINVIHVVRDITRSKRVEESLARSEIKYRTLFEDAGDYILVISLLDPGRPVIIDANNSALKHHGYTRSEMIGKAIWELDAPGIFEKNTGIISQMKKPGDSCRFETVHIRKDGSTFQAEVLARLLQIGNEPPFVLSIERDITQRKLAEEKIQASLKEKEILLREIHHRVKNNMQVISSLLGLASGTITDKKYVDMFRESQNRINSMSLVHENLYLSKDLAKIDFNEYIRDLTSGLFHSHGANAGTIELDLNIEDVSLGIDQAIPCGLIINELITNSLKHAFPQGMKGEIKVSARQNDENMVEIIVSDNGIGIPSDVDFRKTGSLGLHLVTILAQDQLHGTINLDRSKGTEFKISFNGLK